METPVIYGLLIPFAGTSLGAACVFFLKRELGDRVQRGLTGFASGVMVAASVWSLLIPAMEQSAGAGAWARELARIGGQGAFGRSRQGCAADVEAAGYSEDSPLRVVRMIESLVRGSGGEESLC